MTFTNRCEMFSRTIFPACRSVLVKQLFKKYHFTQTDAAKKLGITQGAISNYLSSRRGKLYVNRVMEHPQVMAIINDLVDQFASDVLSEDTMMRAFCEICQFLQNASKKVV